MPEDELLLEANKWELSHDFGADRNVYGKRIIIFLFNESEYMPRYEPCASFSFYWNRDDRDEHCCVCVYELILNILQIPEDIYGMMQEYVWYIILGINFVFLYNYFSFLLIDGRIPILREDSDLTVYGIRMGIKVAIESHIPDCIRDWNLYLYMDENAGITFFPASEKKKEKAKV